MIKLSEHFTLEELVASATAKQRGIPNHPNTQAVVAMTHLVNNVLEPLRKAMGHPIKIGSGFRSTTLNRIVGGVSNSQHLKGQAADLCIDGDRQKGWKWFDWIRNNCEFDQLIWEHNKKGSYWVHVSYVQPGMGRNRKMVIENLLKR